MVQERFFDGGVVGAAAIGDVAGAGAAAASMVTRGRERETRGLCLKVNKTLEVFLVFII